MNKKTLKIKTVNLELEIISHFIKTKNTPIHGRELSRLLKQNQKTTQNKLNYLKNNNALTSITAGKTKLFQLNLNNNHLIYTLFQAQVYKTQMLINSNFEIKKILHDLRELGEAPIIIFGSYAKGYQTKQSDLDILYLGKKLDTNKIQHKYTKKLHTINIPKSEFTKGLEEKQSFMLELMNNHIIIQDIEYFTQKWLKWIRR